MVTADEWRYERENSPGVPGGDRLIMRMRMRMRSAVVAEVARAAVTTADAALRDVGSPPETRDVLACLESRRFEDLVEGVRPVGSLGPHAFQPIVESYEEKAQPGSREFSTPFPVAYLMPTGRGATGSRRATPVASAQAP